MKNPNGAIGIQTHDLPICSAVSQSSAALRIRYRTCAFEKLDLKVRTAVDSPRFLDAILSLAGSISVMCSILYCVIHYHVNAYFKELTEELYYEANSEENLFFWQCLIFGMV
jgi:hypothetical protein